MKDQALTHDRFPVLLAVAMKEDISRPKNNQALLTMSAEERLALMLKILSEDKEYALEYDRFVGGVSYAVKGKFPLYAATIEAVRMVAKTATST